MANLLSTSITGTATTSDSVVIGGTFANNPYNSVSSTRLMFGGGNEPNNYSIGTSLNNFGGNYTKLDLRWHTGIRMGAQPGYGGIRFFSDETLTTRIMSIGETDANIRIDNNLYIGGAGGWITDLLGAKQDASTAITTGNIASQSVSVARQLLSPNDATVVAADSAMPSAGHSFIHTLALGPAGNDGHILGMSWANTTSSYGAQIFLDTDPNDIMAIRSRSSTGVWTSWKTVWHSGNLTNLNQLTNGPGYITSVGNITRLWAESHPDDYYVKANWTGSYWQLTSNHPSPVQVGYADNSAALSGLGVGSFLRDDGWNTNPGQDANTQEQMRVDFTYSNNAPYTGELIRFGSSGYSTQFNTSYGNSDNFAFRTRNGDNGTWNPWKAVIHSGNIASQSVSYADESEYSASTGTTDNIGGVQFKNTGSNFGTNADTIDSNGITYYNAGVSNFSGNATDGALYSQRYSTSWQHQIAGDYRSGMIAVRGKNNGTWTSWRTIIDSSTIGSQSVNYAASAGNSATTSQRDFSGDISTSGMGRFAGWYTGNAQTGLAAEIGTSGGQVYIIAYNRQTSAYGTLNIESSGANLRVSGSTVNVTGGTLQQGGNNVIHAGNIGSQSVNYAASAGSAPNSGNVNPFYNVTAGDGNGLRFWGGSDSYKISMGVGSLYQYGTVSDYSIKMQMNDSSTGRGFTWGRVSYAPIASLNSTSGNFQVAGTVEANASMRAPIFYDSANTGYSWNPNTSSAHRFSTPSGYLDIGPMNGTWCHFQTDRPRFYFGKSVTIDGDLKRYSDSALYIHSANYNSYAPTLTGGGASGSWGISVTGSAGGVAWGNVSSKPAGWLDTTNLIQSREPNSILQSGFYESYLGSGNPTGTWFNYINVRHSNANNGHGYQIGMSYYDNNLWFRSYQGNIAATFQAWSRALGTNTDPYPSNMDQYVRTSDSVSFLGTTSPTILVNGHSDNTKGYRIHNTSGSSVSAMFTNSSNQLVIAAGAVDQINLNKKVLVNGVALGVNVSPSGTAGRIDASNDIVAYSSSDERLKQNITPISNALDKVKSLTGVEFDWKPEYKEAHGHEGHDTGIIAQQVLGVMPTAVRTNDTGYLAVRYEKLIGLLIEANKELAARVEELEKKLG